MYSKIISDIEQVILNNKVIGVFISGGLDSALLSYLIQDTKKRLDSDIVVEYLTVPRYDDSEIHARRVIAYIDTIYGNKSVHHILGNPDLHHSQQVNSSVRESLDNPRFDAILVADNITPTCLPGGPIRNPKSKHPKSVRPFLPYTKDVLVKICIDLGLLEIMKITHSCTESKTLRCKICWQCHERAWAFRQCEYIDPGTM